MSHTMATRATDTPRAPRRDAIENRERLVAAALRAIARDGFSVPVLTIAQEAGLGVATFYRCFPDRPALIEERESTCVIAAGYTATVDARYNLVADLGNST